MQTRDEVENSSNFPSDYMRLHKHAKNKNLLCLYKIFFGNESVFSESCFFEDSCQLKVST